MVKIVLIVSVVFAILCGIVYLQDNPSDFYKKTSEDFGLYRIPLVEPHRLLSSTGGREWYRSFDFPITSNLVDSVCVVKNLIIWNTISGPEFKGKKNYWFIFDTQNSKQLAFVNKSELKKYLNQNSCTQV